MAFEDFAVYAFAARLIERFVLTGLVLIIAVIVMLSFWKTLQKVDFKVSKDDIGVGGNLVLATPVFMVLFMGLFAWVVLSHPITINVTAAASSAPEADQVVEDVEVSLIGMVPAVPVPDARALIADINCAQETNDFSPAFSKALRDLKLAQMEANWQPEWGDRAAFRQWVKGADTIVPDARASQIFFERALPC